MVKNDKRLNLKIPRMLPVNFVAENTIHRLCFTLAAVITKSHAQFKLPEYAKPHETDIPRKGIICCAQFYCKIIRPHKFKPHTLYLIFKYQRPSVWSRIWTDLTSLSTHRMPRFSFDNRTERRAVVHLNTVS